jgi:hypothetical protein
VRNTYCSILVICSGLGLSFIIACTRSGDAGVRPISGTEQVAIYQFCISVSPNERWLAFTEWVLPKARVFDDLPPGAYESRIATLDLQNGQIVRHDVDSTLAADLGFALDDPGRISQAGFELIEQRFRPPGWRGGLMFFQPFRPLPDYVVYVALDSRTTGIRVISEPGPSGTCSDCPPMTSVQFRDRSWDLLSNDVSAVVREGAVRAVYYRGEGPYRTNMILRLRTEGPEEVIVERTEKKRTMMVIAGLRVSPDERYLAYKVNSKKQAFLAGPQNDLFIRDLTIGREKKIARYGYMGNLIWSPDSHRLYFAGGEYASNCAVRVVDVDATFKR